MTRLKKLKNSLNFGNRYKDYINKNVFRGLIIFLFLVLLIGILTEGTTTKITVSCPDGNVNCINMVYKCKTELNKDSVDYYLNDCQQYEDIDCRDNICTTPYLKPGQTIGDNSIIIRNYSSITLFSILIAFGINHLIYIRRKEKRWPLK